MALGSDINTAEVQSTPEVQVVTTDVEGVYTPYNKASIFLLITSFNSSLDFQIFNAHISRTGAQS